MHRSLLALAALLAVSPAFAASVTDLLKAVPPPPATAVEAAAWMDAQGKLRHAPYRQLEAQLAQAVQGAKRLQAEANVAMSGSGMDAARMQDPAYAAQMQQKLMRMSMAEQQAFALQQQQAMQQAMLANMQHVGSEAPAISAAAEAAQMHAHYRMTELQMARARLEEEENTLRARFNAIQSDLDREFRDTGEGCDEACVRRIEAHNRSVGQKKRVQADAEARAWSALFQRERARRLAELEKIEAHLQVSRNGADAKAPSNQSSLATLHEWALSEVQGLLALSGRAAQRVAAHTAGSDAAR